jgi:hypothetical protein
MVGTRGLHHRMPPLPRRRGPLAPQVRPITGAKRHTHPHLHKRKPKVKFTYCGRCLPAIRACEAMFPGRERPIRAALEQGFSWPEKAAA